MKILRFLAAGAGALLMSTAAHADGWTGWTFGVNAGGATSNTRTDFSYIATPASAPPGFEDVFGPGATGVATAMSLASSRQASAQAASGRSQVEPRSATTSN